MQTPNNRGGRRKESDGRLVNAVVADSNGDIFELAGYAAVGMAGGAIVPLTRNITIGLPHGSDLMLLPDRIPILFNLSEKRFEPVRMNPENPDQRIFPVAAFNSPGHMLTYVAAYREEKNADILPLFSYGAVGWMDGAFRSTAIMVDKEKRQDIRFMKREDVLAGIRRMRKIMPDNRLRKQLETCALKYGCPAGKNFFLGRFEAPLPTSRICNARCLGCISLQTDGKIPASQDRIEFVPTAQEIAEIALAHITAVEKSVVSFGQGCEGDPLFAANVIAEAIRLIRAQTDRGTINMNTNGSLPDVLNKLIAAGLDSVRISLNSVREPCYNAYFRPKGYTFSDVLESFDTALAQQLFVSVNYLNCPGFTDTPEEVDAVVRFLREYPADMIQWRNLNYDPVRYWKEMNEVARHDRPIGMINVLRRIHKEFPRTRYGYFNPPKEAYMKAG